MTTQTLPAPTEFVGPCGCFACEKWADCDYCSFCTPDAETEVGSCGCQTCTKRDDALMREEMARGQAEYDAWVRDDAMSFGDWLASR